MPQDAREEHDFELVKSSSESSFEKIDVVRSSSTESFEMVDKSAIPKSQLPEQVTVEPTKDVQPGWRTHKKPREESKPSKPGDKEELQKIP